MSDLKKNLNEIKETISNKEEATKVLSIVMEIVEGFEDKVMEIEKRQAMLEERTGEIMDMLSDMEEELISVLNDDFEAECPYCGERIPFRIPEEGEEFECPKCNNVIELEMMFDDECDCGCNCEDCDHDDCDHEDCDCGCEDCNHDED